jgi:hypothetical protein
VNLIATPTPTNQRALILAILLTMSGGCVLAVLDAISKELTDYFDVVQVIWSRYFFHALLY